MIRIALCSAVVILSGLIPQPAAADYYGAPWCAVVAAGDGDMQWNCEYRSIEECRPFVLAGNRGWCNPNPYMSTSSGQAEHKRKGKRHARAQ